MVKQTAPSVPAPTSTATSGELSIGSAAPPFALLGDDGQRHSLADFAGKRIVLYFYPRDNTPGCTQEACDFRDHASALQDKNTVVIGVSPDSVESHRKFKLKYALPFLLLADPEAELAKRYGAYGEKVLYGKRSLGIIRSTFVIGARGQLESIYRKVAVKGHVSQLLSDAG